VKGWFDVGRRIVLGQWPQFDSTAHRLFAIALVQLRLQTTLAASNGGGRQAARAAMRTSLAIPYDLRRASLACDLGSIEAAARTEIPNSQAHEHTPYVFTNAFIETLFPGRS
jgi:hypothetical protein